MQSISQFIATALPAFDIAIARNVRWPLPATTAAECADSGMLRATFLADGLLMMIRLAVPADIPEMHRVRMTVTENRLVSTVITPADYLDAIERSGRGWVAEVEGVLRGFAIANHVDGSIWALFVEPGYEGCGMGRALHAPMLEWLRTCGCARAWLVTEPGTRAARFYRQAGWEFREMSAPDEARFEIELA